MHVPRVPQPELARIVSTPREHRFGLAFEALGRIDVRQALRGSPGPGSALHSGRMPAHGQGPSHARRGHRQQNPEDREARGRIASDSKC